MPVAEILTLILVGLLAGALGGLLGIGGSIVMIPALTLLFRHEQHVSQAAAMIVNVCVSVPAVLRHQRAHAVPWRVVARMLPAGLVLILIGVEASNYLDGTMLMRIFGVFLIYVIIANLRKLVDGHASGKGHEARISWTRMSTVGGITGFAAGLLGIGGGIIAVPLLQRITHLPLRRCIAASAATMCVTAPIGAVRKNLALVGLGLDPYESLLIAAYLAPTAIIGGLLGATLTHVLPLRWIRIVLLILLSMAAVKFLTATDAVTPPDADAAPAAVTAPDTVTDAVTAPDADADADAATDTPADAVTAPGTDTAPVTAPDAAPVTPPATAPDRGTS